MPNTIQYNITTTGAANASAAIHSTATAARDAGMAAASSGTAAMMSESKMRELAGTMMMAVGADSGIMRMMLAISALGPKAAATGGMIAVVGYALEKLTEKGKELGTQLSNIDKAREAAGGMASGIAPKGMWANYWQSLREGWGGKAETWNIDAAPVGDKKRADQRELNLSRGAEMAADAMKEKSHLDWAVESYRKEKLNLNAQDAAKWLAKTATEIEASMKHIQERNTQAKQDEEETTRKAVAEADRRTALNDELTRRLALAAATGDAKGVSLASAAKTALADGTLATLGGAGGAAAGLSLFDTLAGAAERQRSKPSPALETRFAGAMTRGSREEYSTVINAQNQQRTPQVIEQKRTNDILTRLSESFKTMLTVMRQLGAET